MWAILLINILAVLGYSEAVLTTTTQNDELMAFATNDELSIAKGRDLSGYSWVAPGDFQPTLATKISQSTQLGTAYICRGTLNGNTYPGTYLYEKSTCIITSLGKAVPAQNPVYVLQAKFQMTRQNWMPPKKFVQSQAVIGGRENGQPLFICMTMDSASMARVIGVYTVELHYCHYPSNGSDYEAYNFKILKNLRIANPP